jgi:hypothetical protein
MIDVNLHAELLVDSSLDGCHYYYLEKEAFCKQWRFQILIQFSRTILTSVFSGKRVTWIMLALLFLNKQGIRWHHHPM